jgi:hypothetical protein
VQQLTVLERSEEEMKLEADITANEKAIEAKEAELVALEKEMKQYTVVPLAQRDPETKKEIDRLRKKEEQLRKEKEQLRTKDERLREKELLLLQNVEKKRKVLPTLVKERAQLLLEVVRRMGPANPPFAKSSTLLSDLWPMLDRQSAVESICHSACNNKGRFLTATSQKQLYHCVVITGAAGSGKSRLCREACVQLTELDEVKACFANRSVFVTFLNGEQITAKDVGLEGSVVLGVRVACKLLPMLGLCGERTLDDFRVALGEYVELCSLQTVMCLFGSHFGERKLPLWMTLVIDEAHFAEAPEIKSAPRKWPEMMAALMSYVIPGEKFQPQIDDNVILFPIIASTWSEERSKFHVSPGTKVFPSLLSLTSASFETCVSMLGKFESCQVLQSLLRRDEFRRFLMTCSVAPRSIGMALECVACLEHDGLSEAIQHVCRELAVSYKREKVNREVLEFALSGVLVTDVEVEIGGHTFAHWLSMGFASGSDQKPLSVPFPLLYNGAGFYVEGIVGFMEWGQPFYWQDFEALVPHIIRLRCSSLYRIKPNHHATLLEIFGSGLGRTVRLREAMTVVTCHSQWLVAMAGSMKIESLLSQIATTASGIVEFGSRGYVFAAAAGNVHFDGHLRFQTADNESMVVFYQVKHTQINPDKRVKSFAYSEIQAWLTKARAFVASFVCDEKMFVMVTNKKVTGIPVALPADLILIRQDNLDTFFAPCFLSSARLAAE